MFGYERDRKDHMEDAEAGWWLLLGNMHQGALGGEVGESLPCPAKEVFFFCCTGSLRPRSPNTSLHTLGTHPASARGQPGTWQHPVCTPHMPASPTACWQGWGRSYALSPARHPEHPITSYPKPAPGRGAAGWAASLLPLPRGDIGAPLRHPKSPGSLTPSSHHPSGG